MFVDELTPVFKELTSHPLAFLGGFMSGVLRLSLNEDPVQSWLDQQAGKPASTATGDSNLGNGKGPQSITIE
jgi:hypothetical protein